MRDLFEPKNAIVYETNYSNAFRGEYADFADFPSFLALLEQRCRIVLAKRTPYTAWHRSLEDNLPSLRLAKAYWRKLAHLPTNGRQHLAVIGPTQAGKSTVVNWLLGSTVASVSPLAGHTVNPQAFFLAPEEPAEFEYLAKYFEGYEAYPVDELPAGRFDCFGTRLLTGEGSAMPATVVWDTPDFDSVDAASYLEGVIRTLALADVVVLVVSKEKYADQSVWEVLERIDAFAQPVVLVLNKVPTEGGEILRDSLMQTWNRHRKDQPVALITLPYAYPQDQASAISRVAQEELRTAVAQASRSVRRTDYDKHARNFCRSYWQTWIAPVKVEHAQGDAWEFMIGSTVEASVALYRRDYLDHPVRYEAFQRTLTELLTLLEVPGIGPGVAVARRFITWPMRKLGNLVSRRNSGDRSSPLTEPELLRRLGRHVVNHLMELVLTHSDLVDTTPHAWRNLSLVIRQQETRLLTRFDDAVERYVSSFAGEIENAARGIYRKLEEQPNVLNALRTARATTDAVALAMVLTTGGFGVHDVLLTPAVLSLTSLLAESTAGYYLNRAAATLKESQMAEVQKLLRVYLTEPLRGLVDFVDTNSRLAITPDQLERAEALLHKT